MWGAGVFISTITPQVFAPGVKGSLNYFFSNSSPTVRAVGIFTNTTGATQTITAGFGGNLGSDSDTTIQAKTTGGSTLNLAGDHFVISNDGATNHDPTITHVWSGPGGATATDGQFVNGNDRVGEEWTLTLAPGQTEELMWFDSLNDNLAAALAGVGVFANGGTLFNAGLLAGLSPADLAAIQNWVIRAGPLLQNTAGVPTNADFIVIGPVNTGGGNNTVSTLTFAQGSSLTIFNTLTVTSGPVNLVGGATINLSNASLAVNQLNILLGGLLEGNGSYHRQRSQRRHDQSWKFAGAH